LLQHLAQRALAHVQVCPALEVGGRDLVVHSGVHGVARVLGHPSAISVPSCNMSRARPMARRGYLLARTAWGRTSAATAPTLSSTVAALLPIRRPGPAACWRAVVRWPVPAASYPADSWPGRPWEFMGSVVAHFVDVKAEKRR
jgi:hypothetical protein